MKTISHDITNIKEIQKSKFINFLFKIDNVSEINSRLDKLKTEYKDATHICYAYIIDDKEKASDDGEPSGTAGKPILEILKKHNLNHVLAISVRYFGGIKLGAGGLIRAYANSINDLIKESELTDLIDAYKVRFTVNYDKVSFIENNIKHITYKEFDMFVLYECLIDKNDIDIIKNNSIKYEIIDEIKTSL